MVLNLNIIIGGLSPGPKILEGLQPLSPMGSAAYGELHYIEAYVTMYSSVVYMISIRDHVLQCSVHEAYVIMYSSVARLRNGVSFKISIIWR